MKKVLSIVLSVMLLMTVLVPLQAQVFGADETPDPKITVTQDMLRYTPYWEKDEAKDNYGNIVDENPERLFDGHDALDGSYGIHAWNGYAVKEVVIDLGVEYNISKMELAAYSWAGGDITAYGGATLDSLKELWVMRSKGENPDITQSKVYPIDTKDTAAGVRYLKLMVTGGYWNELTLYGVSNPPPQIQVTPEMIISGNVDQVSRLFDGNDGYDDVNAEGNPANGCGEHSWNAYTGPVFVLDLGDYYDISRIDVCRNNWCTSTFTCRLGKEQEDMRSVFSFTGLVPGLVQVPGKSYNATSSFQIGDDGVGVRYLQVQTNNGYFDEMWIYGTPSTKDASNEIKITKDMVIDTQNATAANLFDGDVSTKWTANGEESFIVDLGGYYNIRRASLYRGVLVDGTFKIEGGLSKDAMNELYVSADKKYVSGWLPADCSALVRYLRISATGSDWYELTLLGSEFDGDAVVKNISDLTGANDTEPGSLGVKLEWTVPAFVGLNTVAPDEYQIVYAKEKMKMTTIDDATVAVDVPAPGVPGEKQSFVVKGLEENTRYWFAVRSIHMGEDGKPVYSFPSNQVEIVTKKDTKAPGEITDLAAVAGSTQIKLSWTATGNDGDLGTADAYELYVSKNEITDQNKGDLVEGMIAPAASGEKEAFVVKGLDADTQYYFALVVKDSKNQSVAKVSAKTLPASAAPAAITDLKAKVDESKDQATLTFTSSAKIFDIRYSTEKITEENFDKATKADVEVIDGKAVVSGLAQAGKYYFAVKAMDNDDRISALSNVAEIEKAGQVVITKDLVIQEETFGNPMLLFDEQGKGARVYDENAGGFVINSTPSTKWNNTMSGKSPVVIDLMTEYQVDQVWVYASKAAEDLGKVITVQYGKPFEWDTLSYTAAADGAGWVCIPVDKTTRYLRIEASDNGNVPKEIVLYGKLVGDPAEIPARVEHERNKLGEIVGTNAFIDDHTDSLIVNGTIREYHNWQWDDEIDLDKWAEGSTTIAMNPSRAGGGWNFDRYYQKLNDAGIIVTPCLKGAKAGVFGSKNESKPVMPGMDATDPEAYQMYGSYVFQMAARYGSQKVDDSLLKVAENQERLSGLNLIYGIEFFNEQDMTWSGRDCYFTPYENAAFQSMGYDGHEGMLGEGYGVKNADPNLKVSVGGTASFDYQRFKAMAFWAQYNRKDGKFPADIINVHHYDNTETGKLPSDVVVGVAPEESDLIPMLEEITEYRDRYLPEVDIHFSEFGWDTNQSSTQSAQANDTYSAWEVQAQWLMRTFFISAAYGVDQAQQYMFRDTGPEETTTGKYGTSGLVTLPDPANGKFFEEKRTSWYYLFTLKNRMGDYRFDEMLDSGNENVWVYRFVNDEGEYAYALWCPTSGGRTFVDGYELGLSGNEKAATLLKFADKKVQGEKSTLTVADHKVAVDVSEEPIMVFESELTDNVGPVFSTDAEVEVTVDEAQAVADLIPGEGESSDLPQVKLYELKDILKADAQAKVAQVTLHWDPAQDQDGVAYYTFTDQDGKTIIPINGIPSVAGSTEPLIISQEIAGGMKAFIPAGKESSIIIRAYDYKGEASRNAIKVSFDAEGNYKVEPIQDVTAPTAPENLEAVKVGKTEVELKWDASTDDTGVKGYHVYANGVKVAEVEGTTATITGLTEGTEYTFTVAAFDEAGNVSEMSNAVAVTTEKTVVNPEPGPDEPATGAASAMPMFAVLCISALGALFFLGNKKRKIA